MEDLWRKSSKCNPNNRECVEVSITENFVKVKDSKTNTSHLHFTYEEWRAFTDGVIAGEFRV
jgi:hypothetical protein